MLHTTSFWFKCNKYCWRLNGGRNVHILITVLGVLRICQNPRKVGGNASTHRGNVQATGSAIRHNARNVITAIIRIAIFKSAARIILTKIGAWSIGTHLGVCNEKIRIRRIRIALVVREYIQIGLSERVCWLTAEGCCTISISWNSGDNTMYQFELCDYEKRNTYEWK